MHTHKYIHSTHTHVYFNKPIISLCAFYGYNHFQSHHLHPSHFVDIVQTQSLRRLHFLIVNAVMYINSFSFVRFVMLSWIIPFFKQLLSIPKSFFFENLKFLSVHQMLSHNSRISIYFKCMPCHFYTDESFCTFPEYIMGSLAGMKFFRKRVQIDYVSSTCSYETISLFFWTVDDPKQVFQYYLLTN